jgi:hypothetical protein
MPSNGFWAVDVADIKLAQCEVGFDDKGKLEVITPPGSIAEDIERLKHLLGSSDAPFSVKIEKRPLITATFHRCRLAGCDRGETQSERVQFFSMRKSEPSTPSMVFRFQYQLE